jgi:hypothetical protein
MDQKSSGAPTAEQSMADHTAIKQVVQNWALWRDTWAWEKLRTCYTADAVVETTWFVGSAADFIAASVKGAGNPDAPVGMHSIGAATVEQNGDRALAETRMILLLRARLEGVEVDVTAHGRFVDWFVRQDGCWRITKRHSIHEKDRLDPVDPGVSMSLDPERLSRLPRAYRHIAYLQSSGGATVNLNLAQHNSPEQQRLYEAGRAWLAQ